MPELLLLLLAIDVGKTFGLLTTVFATLNNGLGMETMLCPAALTVWPRLGFLAIVDDDGEEAPLVASFVFMVDIPSPKADFTSFFVGA